MALVLTPTKEFVCDDAPVGGYNPIVPKNIDNATMRLEGARADFVTEGLGLKIKGEIATRTVQEVDELLTRFLANPEEQAALNAVANGSSADVDWEDVQHLRAYAHSLLHIVRQGELFGATHLSPIPS